MIICFRKFKEKKRDQWKNAFYVKLFPFYLTTGQNRFLPTPRKKFSLSMRFVYSIPLNSTPLVFMTLSPVDGNASVHGFSCRIFVFDNSSAGGECSVSFLFYNFFITVYMSS